MSKSSTPKPSGKRPKERPAAYASPPCFACEMDAAYAGFLPADEVTATLARLARLAECAPAAVRKRWQPVLGAILQSRPTEGLAPAAAPTLPASEAADALQGETRALLPRIADDAIHAALKRLVDGKP